MNAGRAPCDRRAFLRNAAGALAVLSAHEAVLRAARARPGAAPEGGGAPLLREIRLLTAAPLDTMRRFYEERMGFTLLDRTDTRIALAAGATTLVFSAAAGADAARAPFYHFAFNIPRNKLLLAREWQLERTALVPTPERLRDPNYPDDVRHFSHWNAHSLFFFDPAGNIVEHIARHDLDTDAEGPFTSADILCASEIGFVVEDPGAHARALHAGFGLDAYPRGTDNWWAMGDEQGLVLCLPKGRVFGENTPTPKAFDIFPTEATIARPARGAHRFTDKPYTLHATP